MSHLFRLRTKLLLAILLPVSIMGLAIVFVHDTLTRGTEAMSLVAHTNRVIATANALLRTAIDAETGERGYVITGQEDFLRPYHDALPPIETHLAELRTLVADNPEQLQRIDELEHTFTEWREQAAEPEIAARREAPINRVARLAQIESLFLTIRHSEPAADDATGSAAPAADWIAAFNTLKLQLGQLLAEPQGTDTYRTLLQQLDDYQMAWLFPQRTEDDPERLGLELTRQLDELLDAAQRANATVIDQIATGTGRTLMDRFRDTAARFIATEGQLLSERVALSRRAAETAGLVAWIGTTLALLVAGLVAFGLSGSIIRGIEDIQHSARAIAAGRLSERAHYQARDEIGALARIFNTMAEQLEQVIQREQSTRETLAVQVQELVEARTLESTLLNEMGELLQAALSAEEAYPIIARYGHRLFPDMSGALLILLPSKNHLESAAAWGTEAGSLESLIIAPEDCWALRRGKVHQVGPGSDNLRCTHVDNEAAYICLPLIAQGDALGVFHLQNRVAFEDTMLRRAYNFAEHVGLAIANLRLRETLRYQSIRDPLTGLYNRRYMEESLLRELSRATRTEIPLALMMFDIDHFKLFNDTHGHGAGDAVLREIGKLLQTRFRGEDTPCRYGGEEFMLILPGATAAEAAEQFQRLRNELAECTISYRDTSLPMVTISAGVAAFPDHGTHAPELIDKADQALYQAKHRGRDQVVVFDG